MRNLNFARLPSIEFREADLFTLPHLAECRTQAWPAKLVASSLADDESQEN